MPKVAIYSRKSKFTGKGESVENQIEMCKEYLEKNFNHIFDVKIYEDEGFSGKNTERPQFKKMINDAQKNRFNILICYRLDRISRNVADFSNTIELLQKHNIDFISIREQFDTSTPMGRAMMNIAAVFAQLERETIAERIKDNMIELSKSGRWLGGTPPLGYKSEPVEYSNQDGKSKKMYKLTEVEEEMKLVKLIYKLYLDNKSFNTVATYLCKNMFKGKNGGEFSKGTVKQIIQNPVYCISDKKIFDWFKKHDANLCGEFDDLHGLMVYNKRENGKKEKPINEWIIAIGKHEGIIHSDKWIECQNLIEHNKSKTSPRSGTGVKFLLSGLVVCGECGSGMGSWSRYNKKRNFMEKYYRCNLRNRASNRCNNKMLNAYKAEEYVSEYLKDVDLEKLKKAYENKKKNTNSFDNIEKDINKLNNQYNLNKTLLGKLVKKLAIEDDEDIIKIVKTEMKTIKSENDNINLRLNELKNSLDDANDDIEFFEDISNRVTHFKRFYDTADDKGKKLLIQSLVENIVWYSDTDTLEINLIGSGKELPNGKVKRRL